jgi:hypothetical protein
MVVCEEKVKRKNCHEQGQGTGERGQLPNPILAMSYFPLKVRLNPALPRLVMFKSGEFSRNPDFTKSRSLFLASFPSNS